MGHSSLVRAREQREKLGRKIVVIRADRRRPEETEEHSRRRTAEPEKTNPRHILEIRQARMREAGIIAMCGFPQFWSSQVHVSKHMAIAKGMAKEFITCGRRYFVRSLILKGRVVNKYQC